MRVAGLVVGLIGGILGLPITLVVLFVAGLAGAGLLGLLALVIAITGIVGAALAIAKPMPAVACMVVSAVLGFVLVHGFYIVSTLLLLIGAALVFADRRRDARLATSAADDRLA